MGSTECQTRLAETIFVRGGTAGSARSVVVEYGKIASKGSSCRLFGHLRGHILARTLNSGFARGVR
jgi:hypothetical protein